MKNATKTNSVQLKNFMDEYYNGLSLTPDFYHQWKTGIHLELGKGIYQFHPKRWQLNMARFHTIYQQLSVIIPLLFKEADDVLVVVNSYPTKTNKIAYPNFFKRYVKKQQRKYSLQLNEIQWQFDEDTLSVQQMSLFCKSSDLKLQHFMKPIVHQDFHCLQPQFRKKHCLYAADVFIINLRTKCIFHLYDDRGCKIINVDQALHEKLLKTFEGWELQEKS